MMHLQTLFAFYLLKMNLDDNDSVNDEDSNDDEKNDNINQK